MQVVKLFDEVGILLSLAEKTIELIHATSVMDTIKKLVCIHDIISLNLAIEKRFKDYQDNPPWDLAAFTDLNRFRIELILFHRFNFKPISLIDRYNDKMAFFLRLLQLKNSNISI